MVAPLTDATEYGVDVCPINGVLVPVMAPGVARVEMMVIPKVLSGLGVAQPLLALTTMFPLVAPHAKSTVIVFVPCPETMVAPVPVYDQE
jgi:hypothetical protein